MPRFFEKMLLILVMSFSLFAVGCETTDYQPLIMKGKLAELEKEIEMLKAEIAVLKGEDPNAAEASEDEAGEGEDGEMSEGEDGETSEGEDGASNSANTADSIVALDTDPAPAIVEFPNQKKIVVDGTKATSATFEALGRVSALEHLEIAGCNPSPSDLAQLKQLKGLKFLQLSKATLSEEAMKELSEFQALEQIRCGHTGVGDAELRPLENLKTLKAVDLSGCEGVTIDGLESLTKCSKLAFLRLSGPSIDNDCMTQVAKMKSLRVLGISDTEVDDDGIAKLANLNLSEVQMTQAKLSDVGVGYLTGLENLEKLDLSECSGVTNACASEIAKMKNLSSLNLLRTGITDQGVKQLTGMKNLTRLNLDDTRITDDSVAALKELPQLTWLHLGKTAITDREKEVLMGLRKLRYLNISNTEISRDACSEISNRLGSCEIVRP